MEVTEYDIAQDIADKSFSWRVPYTPKTRERIAAAVNNMFHKKHHKFGIEVSDGNAHTIIIDTSNGNTYWKDTIPTDTKAVRLTFRILHGEEVAPPTHQWIRCQIIFDIKMEYFCHNERYVSQVNMTDSSSTLTCTSVVSRESVRILLTLEALHNIEVNTTEIKNPYIKSPVLEYIWITLGPDFGADYDKKYIVTRSPYELIYSGTAFP